MAAFAAEDAIDDCGRDRFLVACRQLSAEGLHGSRVGSVLCSSQERLVLGLGYDHQALSGRGRDDLWVHDASASLIGPAARRNLDNGDDLTGLGEQDTPIADTEAVDAGLTFQDLDVVGLGGRIGDVLRDLGSDQQRRVIRYPTQRSQGILTECDLLHAISIAKRY